ncbi:MAG: hypothetical protein JNL10_20750 [Verrucomicrobiales bacterium]|nr:hypothetical protein [Verrucomicrobiales bacterium]
MLTRKGQDLLALGALMGVLALGAVGAVAPIRVSQQPVDFALDPSPLGYTWSLLLFALPCAVFGIWVSRQRQTPEQRRACALTLAVLIPIGFLMDLLFGRTFLTFPNPKSTLGILVPAFDPGSGWSGLWGSGWKPFLPVEEFAFYALGFAAILLTYVWADDVLFRGNKVDDRQRTPRVFQGWRETLGFWLVLGGILFGIAWFIRKAVPSRSGHAFPGYFLFLLAGSILPSLFCSRVAFRFVNWRALTASWLWILAISQFWEASLAIPYGWWGYQPDQMMGLFLKPHCDLPIEAVLVWTLGSWTTIILYETLLTALHAGRKGWGLFGVVRAADLELDQVGDRHLRAGRGAGAPASR